MSGVVPEESPKVARVNNRALVALGVLVCVVIFTVMFMLSKAGDTASNAATTGAIAAATAPTQEWLRSAATRRDEPPRARDEYLRLRELEATQPRPEEMQEMLAEMKQRRDPETGAAASAQQAANPLERALLAPLVPAGLVSGAARPGAMDETRSGADLGAGGRPSPSWPSPSAQDLLQQQLGMVMPAMAGGETQTTPDATDRHAQFEAELRRPERGALRRGLEVRAGVVPEGSIIPATVISEMVSDAPGAAQAVVSRDVRDAAGVVVIPQGTRALGSYDARVVYGQNRLLVAWHRLIYPDGSSWDLPQLPGGSPAGAMGVRDKVNNHFVRIFGSALLMSAISAGVQIAQPETDQGQRLSASEIAGAAVAQEMGRASAEVLSRNLRIAPTLRIRSGAQIGIQVHRDLVVPN